MSICANLQKKMHFYDKNIIEYVEIVGTVPKSIILNTEGHSRWGA